jgi:hypothetical protein
MTHDDDAPVLSRRTRAPGGRRRRRLTVYLTDEELETIRAAAARQQMAAAAWLGRTGMSAARDREMPAGDALRALLGAVQDVAIEAQRQGRNLNQVVTRLHAAGQMEPATGHALRYALGRTVETLKAADDAMRQVRGAIG